MTNWIHADTWLHAASTLYFTYREFCYCCTFVHIPVATSMIPFLFEQIVKDSIKESQMWYRFLTHKKEKGLNDFKKDKIKLTAYCLEILQEGNYNIGCSNLCRRGCVHQPCIWTPTYYNEWQKCWDSSLKNIWFSSILETSPLLPNNVDFSISKTTQKLHNTELVVLG